MLNAKTLANSLTATLGTKGKKANAYTDPTDVPVASVDLQSIIGDPDTDPLSFSVQTHPSTGETLLNNPLSPVEGDEAFFSGLMDGSRFQANDGSWWDIVEYNWEGAVMIQDAWHPRTRVVVSIQDVRRAIHSWISPFQQRVPPPPPGVTYSVVETRQVK